MPVLRAGAKMVGMGSGSNPIIQAPSGELVQLRRGGRRMNVVNPKALRRSLRRVAGFGKLAARMRRDIGRAATSVGVARRVVVRGKR